MTVERDPSWSKLDDVKKPGKPKLARPSNSRIYAV